MLEHIVYIMEIGFDVYGLDLPSDLKGSYDKMGDWSFSKGDLIIMFSDGLRDNLHDREATVVATFWSNRWSLFGFIWHSVHAEHLVYCLYI